ncbi:subtilase family protein [Sulfurirhabdus autotrophica]|uniref:Subtilase family protein n=2 Tax=Sulfurirhabdus autotrophica TaxID=1706046 RepID=A0A4R3XX07_9PROT|nr:subtilase family protein [Sulfurirhabdus autotrophica]
MIEGRVSEHVNRVSNIPALASKPVTIILETDTLLATDVEAQGGVVRYNQGRLHEISIPAGKLTKLLSRLPSTTLARFPYHHEAVSVTGQGVAKTGAADMQAIGNSGAGIKIGIIDLGFASLSTAQASGDLPSNLSIIDYTGTGTGGIDHGTNVAEIVHEMAPGASLYLAKISTEVQLSQALNDMAAAGVRVINHSVAWFGAAFYDGTGSICTTANSADSKGIQWVNAMGNARAAHYLGTFTDINNDLRHEFSTGQNFNTIILSAGFPVSLILNWDAYPSTKVDYNLYLYNGNPDNGGTLVASSQNKQSGSGPSYFPYPYESIDYTPPSNGTYYIVVKKVSSSTTNLPLTLFSTGPELGKFTPASSLLQPADCANVLGVGAVDLNDSVEYFSSEGPTTNGNPKPEISAPNRVQTSLTSSFAGTSAASPHVAGAAALLLAKNPNMTPPQLRATIQAAVKDISTAGFDFRTGFGRISLDADGDGLNHDDELFYGTSPINADTDGDGLSDWAEIFTYGTNPTVSNKGDISPKGAPDGKVNISDLLILTRFVEGLDTPTIREKLLADMNNDGVLDIRDVLLMRRLLGF